MFESFEKSLEYTSGTVKEMELRYIFAAIRKAADNMERYVEFPTHDISNLHMPTLEHEILRPAGFKFKFLPAKKGSVVDNIIIFW